MNVTELARKLKISTEDLLEVLPQVGFDIGRRAIKVDDRLAQRIINEWPKKMKELQIKVGEEEGEKKEVEAEEEIKEVKIPHYVVVKDFAIKLGLPVSRILMELMKSGILSAQNEKIDFETASIVAEDLGYKTSPEDKESEEEKEDQSEKMKKLLKEEKDLEYRAPVVVVMGHVDHGKTKLLDAIRKTNVVDAEAGGITQHIGAYQTQKSGKLLTFIDTPGHEAFTAMRSRGARIADIAILVVAVDDGVKPQTKEVIDIIKAAKLPMIVAINKIDKEGVNIEKVKSELSELGLTPEDWGGKTIMVPISAKKNMGIDDILDMLLLVADMEKDNIKASPTGKRVSTVIESHVDRGEGPVATILVKNGTFKTGDFLAINNNLYGKIKAMKNWQGETITEAGPSVPVKILGLKSAPFVGDIVEGKDTDKGLDKDCKSRLAQENIAMHSRKNVSADAKNLNLIIKADVLGSLEAIVTSIEKISHPQIKINVVGKILGNITEGDILQAEANHAEIISFHVGANPGVEDLAIEKKVKINYYSIIYKLLEDLTAELESMLEAEIIKHKTGRLKVLAIFKAIKGGQVIGGKVIEGKIIKESKAEIFRNDKKVGQSKIMGLQSGKADVNEVVEGEECGINLKCDTTIVEGDILEIYSEEKKEQKIG